MEPLWKDPTTGLEWSATASGRMTWQEAVDWCQAQGDGWRLPTVKELFLLTDHDRQTPAVVGPLVEDTASDFYWSSTTFANGPYAAWGVDFGFGYVSYSVKGINDYVRAVRGGSES